MIGLDVDFNPDDFHNSINDHVIFENRLFYNNYIYNDRTDILHFNKNPVLIKEIYHYGIIYINLEDEDLLIIPYAGINLDLHESIKKLVDRIGNYQPSIYDIEGLFMK